MSVETYSLPERVGVDSAQDVLNLAASLEADARISLNAAMVQSADGPAVIAIANVAHTLARRDAPVEMVEPTDEFLSAFADLGLEDALAKMEIRT